MFKINDKTKYYFNGVDQKKHLRSSSHKRNVFNVLLLLTALSFNNLLYEHNLV